MSADPPAATPSPQAPPTKRKTHRVVIIVLVVVIGGCALTGLIGILAAIAVPAFMNYTKKSKTSEASANLRTMRSAVQEYCHRTQTLPGGAGPLPLAPTHDKQQAAFAADPVFAEVGFAPMEPVYYSYSIAPTADGMVRLVARGDLDGDGTQSLYEITCKQDGCECGDVYVEQEIE